MNQFIMRYDKYIDNKRIKKYNLFYRKKLIYSF